MKTIDVVLCGVGGQGILFMTKALAQAALDKGYNVMGAETHGMAQRGGSVVSHMRFGDAKGSLVKTGSARFLFALEENEAYRNLPFLGKGAAMYVNSDSPRFPREEVGVFLARKNVICHSVPATAMAQELGVPMSSNLALLGYFSAFEEEPVSHGEMRATVEKISPARLKEENLKIFDAGFERGMKERQA
jgi:indolepyruvate ferredoxin oxidoreductase beta subunit